MPLVASQTVAKILKSYASTDKAKNLSRFFKTGKGEYGEGDKFMGIVVPNIRKVAKEFYMQVTLETIQQLVKSPYHEVRLCALIMLVYQYNKADNARKHAIYEFYLKNTKYINNWDLVDLTAPNIVGEYLLRHDSSNEGTYFAQSTGACPERSRMDGVRRKQNTVSSEELPKILIKLSLSQSLWERRIAILSTFAFIRVGRYQEAFAIAELLLHDKHDLIHKAVGWMLREVGKRISKNALCVFLDEYYTSMPRTTLRYAIEHFAPSEKAKYMNMKPKARS